MPTMPYAKLHQKIEMLCSVGPCMEELMSSKNPKTNLKTNAKMNEIRGGGDDPSASAALASFAIFLSSPSI